MTSGMVCREKEFHDELIESDYASRRLAIRLAASFYNKEWRWKQIWHSLGDLKDKVVLDYGCGPGWLSVKLAERGAQVYGIDISEKCISVAKRRFHSLPVPVNFKVRFDVMDAHSLEFSDDFFDFVFGEGMLHHLDLERAYKEVSRVLKPGGRAFFVEPLAGHPLVGLFRRLTPNARTRDEKPLTMEDIEKARQYFRKVDHREYFFIAVLAAPINLFSQNVASIFMRGLNLVDQFLFRIIPSSRCWAWTTIISLEK